MSAPTLDDLISLNHEISAFVRAGIPIELGLKGLSGSVGSRLGRLSARLSERMANGMNLSDAIAQEGPIVSPVYTAVVEAGIASGNLPEALQSLSLSAQVNQDTRRRMMLAAIYPLICLFFAYQMFCLFVTAIAPHIIGAMKSLSRSWPIDLLQFLHRNSDYVTKVIPAAFLAFVVITFLLRETVARGLWQRMTSFRWIIGRSLDWAQFTEILALQVEHHAPLARAFVLAADSTESRRLQRDARRVQVHLTNGASLTEALKEMTSLPPLVRWMLATGEKQGALAETLRQLSEMYRRQALRRAAIVKVWFPVTMTVAFTAVIGLTYGLAFFIPLRGFLLGLMQE